MWIPCRWCSMLLIVSTLSITRTTLQVVEGYEVVKAIEACGSRSGDTAFDVMIADCGQLDKSGVWDNDLLKQ